MTKLFPRIIAVMIVSLAFGRVSRAEDPAGGKPGAYAALHAIGDALGADALNRVVEVTGRGGTPEPAFWRILLKQGDAGTREVKVSGGRVVSQESSNQPTLLKSIGLKDLNLDSTGALEEADNQAHQNHVRFDSLDYTLRVNAATGKPEWDLEMFNQGGTHVGGMRLAASDGATLSVNGLIAGSGAARPETSSTGNINHDVVRPVPADGSTVVTTTTTTQDSTSTQTSYDDGGFFRRAGQTLDHATQNVGNSLDRAGHSVDHGFRRTGGTLQRFFTGHSDIDSDLRNNNGNNSNHDSD